MNSAHREVREEAVMKKYPEQLEIIGYVNLEHDIHAVHFGVVLVGHTEEEIAPADGMKTGKWYALEELDAAFSNPSVDVEEWTKQSWPAIKAHLLQSH